ncbi:type I phosphomannose isomerase catalytic subunit [Ascidiimonas sp. W6]|uniref:type I phosphomannose isomerase catalytic subunit n=1 Tax=Ascidiimonas meishanensis TaxID=3128903 RepID=UPI0030EB6FDB
MYPLKFAPQYKERLWGGTKLRDKLGKSVEGDLIGESWEISGVEGSISEVINGELKGTKLNELIETYRSSLLGKKVYDAYGTEFPVLIKFIDAKQDLSIQLHPNDELAKKRHNSFGKTEMWHVMQADENAELIVGFNRDVTKEEYQTHLDKNALSEILNCEKVTKGDTFFINTGKIHAIGAGVLLAEIQQTSDITYRVYDWNRKDKDGNSRELHTELALDAIDYSKKDDFKVSYEKRSNEITEMVKCPYFTTKFLKANQDLTINIENLDSFSVYICVNGETTIANEYGKTSLKKGETVLIPANSKELIFNTKNVEILQVYM